MKVAAPEKALSGVFWNLIEKFGVYGIRLFLTILLARLLSPADFGLVGLVTVFFTVAQIFIEGGFSTAYIQKKEVTQLDADTVFFVNLIISIIFYVFLWLLAPTISRFYDQPQLVYLIRVMAFSLLVNPFIVIQVARLVRNIDFKLRTKLMLGATILSGMFGIYAALSGYGVWSLVIQQLSKTIIFASALWVFIKWRPSFRFSATSFKEMFSYGFWILSAGIVRTLFDNIYILVIGKYFPVAHVGYYTKSKQLQMLAANQISSAVGLVSFPMFSKMIGDEKRIRNAMRRVLNNTMLVVIPVLLIMIIVSEPLVLFLLTDKWAPMVPYFEILCFIGMLYPLHSINIQVIQSQGYSRLNFFLNVFKNSLRIINVFFFIRYSILHILYGELVLSVVSLFVNTIFTKMKIGYGLSAQLRDISNVVFSAILAGLISCFTVRSIESDIFSLVIGIFLTPMMYVCILLLYDKNQFLGYKKLFKSIIQTK